MSIAQCPTCGGTGLISMGAVTQALGTGATSVCPTCLGHGQQQAIPGETQAQLSAEELAQVQQNAPGDTSSTNDVSAAQ